ncbi:hypothetical protein, partial [uncultured Methylobacterium sp.]|uniref:hypothetical protein n=1 Tax=uncultured Methylobacterium sp. TaxID=157278 RepID=UPI002598AAB7
DESANYMPRFPVPEGETEDTWFVKEVEKGLAYRYPEGITPEVMSLKLKRPVEAVRAKLAELGITPATT